MIKGMRTAVNDNSKSVALEEKFAMVSEQLCSVTERLDHAERDLDLERASREDIINAEVERRLKKGRLLSRLSMRKGCASWSRERKSMKRCSGRKWRSKRKNFRLHTQI